MLTTILNLVFWLFMFFFVHFFFLFFFDSLVIFFYSMQSSVFLCVCMCVCVCESVACFDLWLPWCSSLLTHNYICLLDDHISSKHILKTWILRSPSPHFVILMPDFTCLCLALCWMINTTLLLLAVVIITFTKIFIFCLFYWTVPFAIDSYFFSI